MRKLMWALLFAFTVAGLLAQEGALDAQPGLHIDQEHTQWIQHVMRSISTIKAGMTRRDLPRVFAEDGGLSTRSQGRFVYRQCPYIKVDVELSPADEGADQSPDDKIVRVSRPYLEYPVSD
jgi:hypothetical protein